MDLNRRQLLRQGSALALLVSCGVATLDEALAAEPAGFEAKTFDEALASLGGKPADSKDVTLVSPDIAENGAVVPVAVTSAIPKTESIAILIEKNPEHAGRRASTIPAGTDPFVVDARQDGRRAPTSTRWSRPTASATSTSRKSRSRSAAAAAEHRQPEENRHGRSDAHPRAIEGDTTEVRVLMSARDGDRTAQGRAGQDDSRRGSSRR